MNFQQFLCCLQEQLWIENINIELYINEAYNFEVTLNKEKNFLFQLISNILTARINQIYSHQNKILRLVCEPKAQIKAMREDPN